METSRCRPVGTVQMEFQRLGEMSYQVMRRHGGAFMVSERSPSEKTIYCMRHAGKVKTMETVKRSVVIKGSQERRDEWLSTGIFGAEKSF